MPQSNRCRNCFLRLVTAAGLVFVVFATTANTVESAGRGERLDVVRHSATVSEANALIAEVRVSLSRPARVFVEYDNPVAGRYRTALGSLAAEHVIPILRLRPATHYDYTVFTVRGSDASDAVRGPGGSFTTGVLPAPLASIYWMATGRSSQPLILTDYKITRGSTNFSYFLILDEVGALVWYLPLGIGNAGAVARPPGRENFVFMPYKHSLREFTPLSEVTDLFGEVPRSHHDFFMFDDGRVLLPIRHTLHHDSPASGGSRTTFVYDSLDVWHPATGRVEQVWSAKEAWDIFDPTQHWTPRDSAGSVNWTHINSVSLGPRGNIVLSSRSRSQVVSLSPDYKIEWQLHGPDSDYKFPNPADRFYKQHTASQLAHGNILLFDNGNQRPEAEGGEYSRALELRLDEAAGTATKVWEYRPDPDIFSDMMGSAYRLNNGNTLVNFGFRGEDAAKPLLIVEADANGNEVFRVDTVASGTKPTAYRANVGVEAIHGETMLRPPLTPEDRYERMTHVNKQGSGRLPFDLYLGDRQLIFAKDPCEAKDTALRFLLHVVPKEMEDLPAARRDSGFDNLDFNFADRGVRWRGRCLAELWLPEYRIDHIRTGQFVAEDGAIDGRDGTNGSSASAPWSVEIPVAP